MLPWASGNSRGCGWPSLQKSKINRHPSDADFPPPHHRHHHRFAFTTLSSILCPIAACCFRLVVCIGMSAFGGLTNRMAYSPSRWALLRDVAAAAALENNLVLVALESAIAIPYQPAQRRPNNTHKQIRGRSSSLSGYGVMRASKRVVHRGLVGMLCVVWIVASWGDYVFESESRGLIPTMWLIAPGLKDPSVHAGVQMRNHRDVFVGGLVRCVLGLCIGLGYAVIVHRCCSSSSSTKRAKPYSRDGHTYKWTMHMCASFHNSRFLFDTLKTPKMLGWNIAALVTFFWLGAWAPLTNLICCILGIFLLTPPGGAIGNNEAVRLPTIRGSSHNGSSKRQRPNVVVVVHESLSGAAMQSARGIDAAPFFHSMRSSPDFYDFRFARTTMGVPSWIDPECRPVAISSCSSLAVYRTRHVTASGLLSVFFWA